ncbi:MULTISPECIES: GNAT family N-acetyltransferase [unclassified Rhizobium]|uniref:GNAT family N-acetyltransferase n=1 Tax=unclassified Rhizobium TaxID=2613769 RepID=UPI0007153E40|nr:MULTISPECIES: GNAT family N-acetyltransferase [unclassified Rhizobium]KQS87457.1 aminoglycoside adenylyltransferase [Rhizobium sp. Leaf391]KQT06876.1 aminoglycoside adenylyltransferase [Rhizobium sp. Leaf386]KQT95019.1 aminoglycoside adenylyltransferase [Rhizobium sp. Leaf453]
MQPDPRYHFRDVRREDFPMLGRWLTEPHVAKWWGEADEELEGIESAMTSVETRALIVELDGRPIAYLQSYDPHLEPGHPYQDQPPGTLGVDISIGDPVLIGKGHGSAIIRQFCAGLFAGGASRIVIDPDPDNAQAIRAYEKAGFRFLERRQSIYGPAHFMALDKPEETDLP